MTKISIVTDSTAHFIDPLFPARHAVTVVPLTIHFGKHAYREGTDLSAADFFRRLAAGGRLPSAASPTVEHFTEIYETLSQTCNQIISLHISGKLSRTARNAAAAAENLRGRCKIEVIDSLSTSVGLGWLVENAVAVAERGEALDDAVRLVRGLLRRLYVVFFVDTLEYLAHAGRIGRAQALLGDMLGIKPILALEDGDIVAIEKVRTRAQAVERLLEFVTEFADIRHLAILQSAPEPTEDTRLVGERLAVDYSAHRWPTVVYGPSLGTFLGPNAMGIVVMEGEAISAS